MEYVSKLTYAKASFCTPNEANLNFLKRFHWFELALIMLVMGVHIYAAFSAPHNFSSRWFVRDDAYYYFKVAQNVSEGRGSTFDGINPTNGYHPLWMLACVPIFALARFDLVLPLRVLVVVMAAFSVISSILLFRLLKKPAGEPIAMLAAAYWALDLTIHGTITQQGLETGLVALSVILLLRLIQLLDEKETLSSGDYAKLALAALFVLFSRLDGIYLVLIVGVWVVFRRAAIRYLVPVDLLLTFSVVVWAFIQRAGLKFYLLVFADSAILMSALTFVLQAVIFYFLGLYDHPKNQTPRQILLRALAGVSLITVLSAGIMFLLGALGLIEMPRAVPLLTWPLMVLLTLGSRFGLRIISQRQEYASAGTTLREQIKTQFAGLSKWLRAGFVYYGILSGGLLTYMGINRLLFGTFMPVSGQIKRWWGSLPNNVYGGGAKSVLDVYTLDPFHSQSWGMLTQPLYAWAEKMSLNGGTASAWYWAALITLLAVWLFGMLRKRSSGLPRLFQTSLIPLAVSAQLHGFLYGAMGYAASHEWYWVTQMLALVIAGALGLRGLLDLLPARREVRIAAWVVCGALGLLLAFPFTTTIIRRMPYTDPLAGQPYMDMLPTLEGYTEEGAIIGMTGGGNAGYFIRGRTIVNMDGLINSYAYFQAMKAGKAGEYLAAIGLDYVFANHYIVTVSMPYVEQFTPEEFIFVEGAPEYGRKELMEFSPRP
jgi:hypothetical protein